MSFNTNAEKISSQRQPELLAEVIVRCNDRLDELEEERSFVNPDTEFDRQETLDLLNQDFDLIPFEDLRDSLKGNELEHKKANRSVSNVDKEIDLESRRLDALARSLPAHVREQAIKAAQAKIDEFKDRFEPGHSERHARLSSLAVQIALTSDAEALFSREWYVAAENRPEEEVFTSDNHWDDEEETETTEVSVDDEEQVEEEQELGPYAELADQIPTLTDRLERSYSSHQHIYGEIETAYTVLTRILDPNFDFDTATDEEKAAYTQVKVVLPKFIPSLMKNGELQLDHPLLKVYTTEDIDDLQRRFRAFSPKDRAEFDGLESRVLQTAEVAFNYPDSQIPKDLEGALERMHAEAPNRIGLRWDKLNKYADLASDAIRQKMKGGGKQNLYLKEYIFDARDTSGTEPNFSFIYQFIADEFALEVHAKRLDVKSKMTNTRFENNYHIITEWYKEAKDLIDQVPREICLAKRNRGRVVTRHGGKEQFNAWSAVRSITGLIEDISIRRNGTGDPKVLRHKSVERDYQGALNAQFALGHMVDEMIERLRIHGIAPDYVSEDITPLD